MLKRRILLALSATLILNMLLFAALPSVTAGTCTRYFSGTSKGLVKDSQGWHHYVNFAVNLSAPDQYWKVTKAPLSTSLWPGYYDTFYKRAGYSWPSNWWDPFPASSWQICLMSSP